MKYLVGIDIGTSATKILLIAETGEIISSISQIYPMDKPRNGWAEQSPEVWQEAVISGLTEVIQKSQVKAEDIKGIGLSGQMHGVVMLDQKGKLLRNSIIWCDQRSNDEADEMNQIMPKEKWLAITANPPLAAWSAAKILWLKKHEPDLYAKCAHILLPKDYIRYILTGEFATDVSDASGTQLLDVKNRHWSGEVLQKLKIRKELLPKVYESHEITGTILSEIAEKTGLSTDTVVAAGASDNAAAAIGMGVVREGQAFVSIGTSAIIYSHMDTYKLMPEGSLHVCCSAVDGCWHTMGGPQAAGMSLQWFTDNFCHEYEEEAKKQKRGVFDIINEKIMKVPPGADRLLYLPYLMGERTPNMNPNCRGAFIGLNTIHTKANMLRAVMEGVGFSMTDCNEVLQRAGISILLMRICGGGSKSQVWTQILADIMACDLATMEQDEGPSYGAAILAGVAAGIYPDVKAAGDALLAERKRTRPFAENTVKYQKYHQLYQKFYLDMVDNFTTLAQLQ